MKYEREPEIQPAPRPSTEDAYMAWDMQGYIHDFGLSAQDAFDLARRDWEIHLEAQSCRLPKPQGPDDELGEQARASQARAKAKAEAMAKAKAEAIARSKAESRARKRAAAAKCRKVRDFRGAEFPSFVEMCRRWGVSPATVRSRLAGGWSLEKALRTRKGQHDGKAVNDHLGNKYPSVSAMCKAYGISTRVWYHRRAIGLSLRQALEAPVGGARAVVDHLGTRFRSVSEMVSAWGVSRSTYESRIEAGRSLEEALTAKPGAKAKKEEGK